MFRPSTRIERQVQRRQSCVLCAGTNECRKVFILCGDPLSGWQGISRHRSRNDCQGKASLSKMEAKMICTLPKTDSIRKLAKFWDAHDVTQFEDELEEVQDAVFERHDKSTIPASAAGLRPTSKPANRNKHHTSWAGVLGTAAELSRRSYDVTITLGNTPTTDLLVASPNGSAFRVEVKSASTPNFIPIQKSVLEAPERSDLMFVIALVPRKNDGSFRFFVMSHADVRAAWQVTRKTKKSGEAYKPGWEGLNWSVILPFENRWDKLPDVVNRPAT